MKILHHGFDGLDLAIRANIPESVATSFEDAKAHAQERRSDVPVEFGGLWFMVKEAGARGGYRYTCSQQDTGTWFFKKPSPRDPWGIRFSAGSGALLTLGLGGLRKRIEEICESLGVAVRPDDYSLSRVDFAIDFLAPNFVPDPENFVSHSHTARKTIADALPIQVNGRSLRTTSVTVGKMPGRQVIIYDKRAEVIARRKAEWPVVWGKALHGPQAAPLSLEDRTTSQVWRVEIRAGKRSLKDDWFIIGWSSLYDQLPKLFANLLKDIRYCIPQADQNRSRWETAQIWRTSEQIVSENLFHDAPKLDPEEYRELQRAQKRDELLRQMFGLSISIAAIESAKPSELVRLISPEIARMIAEADQSDRKMAKRFADATERYRHLVD